MSTVAHAQAGAPPKPTKADAQNVVQIIGSDKAKTAIYCSLAKLGEEAGQAEQKQDRKKLEEVNKQAAAMGQNLGPEYGKLIAGLASIDPKSNEGKGLAATLEPLGKLCGK
jgi:hypothetical protein